MMVTACLAVLVLTGPQKSTRPGFFDDLAHWRKQFESVLKGTGTLIGYTQVSSELLGGAHGDGLYPIGSASERYMISVNEDDTGALIYEKRHKGSASIVWHVNLVPAKNHAAAAGTLLIYLQKLGLAISSRSKLTEGARRQLAQSGYFAAYSYHPELGGQAWVVKPDGSSSPTIDTHAKFSITPEEKRLLTQK
jgi:hypothetical protein